MVKEDSDSAKRLSGLAAVTSPVVKRPHTPSPSASAISGSTNISAPSAQPLAPAQTSTTKVVEDGLSSNAASIGRFESLVKPSTKERLRKIAIARAASKNLASKSSVVAPAVSENHHAEALSTATPLLPKLSPSSSSSLSTSAASEPLRPSEPSTPARSSASSAFTGSFASLATSSATLSTLCNVCIHLTIFIAVFFAVNYAVKPVSQLQSRTTKATTAAAAVAQGQPNAGQPVAAGAGHAQRAAGGKAPTPAAGQAQSAKQGQLLTRRTAVGTVFVGTDGRARRRIRFVPPPDNASKKVTRKRAVM
ncbi:hypothetical protein K525DRAFT_208033 [Schizophyllum commune Loenen D]|nr:hypothetical protein K525DRAFT_208033 [Schizophyllum commune Loenen D]